jgi:hypothetical protein
VQMSRAMTGDFPLKVGRARLLPRRAVAGDRSRAPQRDLPPQQSPAPAATRSGCPSSRFAGAARVRRRSAV